MGVPAFFRWLTKKYPSVIIDCIESRSGTTDGGGGGVDDGVGVRQNAAALDSSQPNPNQVEFDNLYLDMNGIIHPCTHPEDKPAPKDEDEMMVAIFECIDRLFHIVRPRKVLYMAIDGVAPRAKMNQQRSRRFRASKEAGEKVETLARLRAELEEAGAYLPPEKPKESHFDSNCITPGTPFMDRLSQCLQYYIHDRLNHNPGWRNIKVILSDANVPGEGEHKIMDFIRRQRAQPDHDPNTQHVLCGADADLIMLGLATHEPNFTIIREEFKPNQPRPCDLCRQMGHNMVDCTGAAKPIAGSEYLGEDPSFGEEVKFIFVRLSVLREYLRRDLAMPNLPFPYDFERAVDDWVFMCFFVGNDFLPHLPSLEIREGAIDRLVRLYKDVVYKTGGFITDSGIVNPSRVQMIMQDLGQMEDRIFKDRQQREERFKQINKSKRRREKLESDAAPKFIPGGQFAPVALGGRQELDPVRNAKSEAYNMRVAGLQSQAADERNTNNQDAARALKAMLKSGEAPNPGCSAGPSRKRKYGNNDEEEEEEETPDEVRLYEDGFKDRYYESKFGVLPTEQSFRHKVAAEYTLGLCWVLRYYYQGCASWKWYFPYHYAPFASDFVDISGVANEFENDTVPFQPLQQLMSVFPAASRSHVPKPWGELMIDPECPIIDFYPEDFKIDLNGKKYAWQGVALLPFVDERRLKLALEPLYLSLTNEEKRRNVRGDDRLYVREGHSGFKLLRAIYDDKFETDLEIQIDGKIFQGMRGKVLHSTCNVELEGDFSSPVANLRSLSGNRVVCVRYRDLTFPADFLFPAKRLPEAKDPPNVLRPEDLIERHGGGRGRGGMRGNWKPRMGFNERRDAASLDPAGHRMLGHHVNRYGSVIKGHYITTEAIISGIVEVMMVTAGPDMMVLMEGIIEVVVTTIIMVVAGVFATSTETPGTIPTDKLVTEISIKGIITEQTIGEIEMKIINHAEVVTNNRPTEATGSFSRTILCKENVELQIKYQARWMEFKN
ncbi:hypothetical protein TCAL_12611 [Tigriopus californicus]|uniref:5'-3' exoribonuclease n=1 Tax=Tigriopus californicus TaxID=6832 RepID=A0A553P1D1_TIGCA|nr:hypothetical protein TCAL_12611 [Tigriopus californicus]|eukprot:TCALIF_12611-PA protein Name:"Similar to Rat1 5'-3' exoribonuclease 2 homolog (Drosophila melanogaster)" AED:0.18 eAED:0.18 QI:261/0.75/0.66/1/0.62/0.77/9/0/1003